MGHHLGIQSMQVNRAARGTLGAKIEMLKARMLANC
jgi:hypothetical protein